MFRYSPADISRYEISCQMHARTGTTWLSGCGFATRRCVWFPLSIGNRSASLPTPAPSILLAIGHRDHRSLAAGSGLLSDRLAGHRGYLGTEVAQRDHPALALLIHQRDHVAPDVDGDHLLRAASCTQNAPLAGKALAGGEVRVVFIGEAAHEPPTRARDLRRVQREILVLGELQRDRFDLA